MSDFTWIGKCPYCGGALRMSINGCELDDLYEVVLREIEAPLFAEVMRYCEGNQSRAAACLGINRATLRKKLKSYDLA